MNSLLEPRQTGLRRFCIAHEGGLRVLPAVVSTAGALTTRLGLIMVSAAEPKRRRPRGVTLLALGVLTIASLNLVRCVLAVRQWTFLSEWSGTSPLYLLLTGTVWSLVGWSVWAGLWWGKRWAPGWLIRLGVVYSIYFWLERLFLYDRSASIPVFQPVLPGNWVFLVGLNLVSLVFMFWTLRRKKTEAYFMNPSPRRP